jgi:hypothetical protein
LWAYVPHVDQHPYVLVPEGRTDPSDHSTADYRVEPFNIKSPPPDAELPVAGLPHYQGTHGEAYQVTSFTLTAHALDLVEQQFRWFRKGLLEGELFEIRKALLEGS